MGQVFKAVDTRLDRAVALKVLSPDLLLDEASRARFAREAKAIASLNHPHICTLFDIGHDDGLDYLVMEYLEGETLDKVLERGPLAVDAACRCAAEILDALGLAHRSGITHRDLKPTNVIITGTGAKLLDANLRWVGAPKFTAAEQEFAKKIQRTTEVPEKGMADTIHPLEGQPQEGGSTDVGDVSWVVPTLNLTVATAPLDAPWHAWPVVATGGMSIGHKGMIVAAKTLAATMVDLYEKPQALREVRAEFEKKREGVAFKAYLPDGPPPVPVAH
jgi:serine/threonine protein kinase